jgi:hypothetical protein
MFSTINGPVFLFSLIFGLLYMYFIAQDNKEIIVYPTEDNEDLFQFRDKVDNCFKLRQSIVKCSNDVDIIPPQI